MAYVSSGCVKCHGDLLKGGPRVPPLRNLRQYWDEAKLEAYLADPVGYAQRDVRLKQQALAYVMSMPPVKDAAARSTLAKWLLTQ